MKKIVLLLSVGVVLISANDRNLSLSLKGSFTTNTRFLYNIDKPNVYSTNRTLSSNLGYGADIRWNVLWERFYLGFSVEKVSGVDRVSVLYENLDFLEVPYEEGFDLLGLELSGYYVVPISSEQVQFYIGGGFGTYDGKRNFSIARISAETISSRSYIGIHVMTGIDYRIYSRIGLRFEIKFRDPHFDVTTKFEQASAEYQGKRVLLPQGEYVTKVNLYGVNYAGGVVIAL